MKVLVTNPACLLIGIRYELSPKNETLILSTITFVDRKVYYNISTYSILHCIVSAVQSFQYNDQTTHLLCCSDGASVLNRQESFCSPRVIPKSTNTTTDATSLMSSPAFTYYLNGSAIGRRALNVKVSVHMHINRSGKNI